MKDIKGYEGLYAVTPEGEVWSYRNECFLKPVTNRYGYLRVVLFKDNEKKMNYIHRIIAETFLPNPENLPQVNHKDENKANNCLQNLEWCDSKYNANYGTRNEKVSNKHKKPILQYTLDGEFVKEWRSASDVGKKVSNNIRRCLRGRNKTAYGYIWKYKNDINIS